MWARRRKKGFGQTRVEGTYATVFHLVAQLRPTRRESVERYKGHADHAGSKHALIVLAVWESNPAHRRSGGHTLELKLLRGQLAIVERVVNLE
jgi:hypothetical protein